MEYTDGGSAKWRERIYFKWVYNPEHAIDLEADGDEYDLYATDLDYALDILAKKNVSIE